MGIGSNSEIFASAVITLGTVIPANKVSKVVEKISLEALERLVEKTPVDTGRSRGNWDVTTAGRSMAAADDSRMDKTGGNSKSRGAQVIGEATKGNKMPKSIYITNNVDYIEDLENGNSKRQAPEGILNVVVNELVTHYGGIVTPHATDDYSDLPI